MSIINIKRAVKNGGKVKFKYYFDGRLFYKTDFSEVFSVPVSDCGDAKFLPIDKAMLFMRYMRKHNDDIKENLKGV